MVRRSESRGTALSVSPGFTLVELMIVVVIMGVLATLSVYGVRQYIKNAKTTEAFTMITAIEGAEESIRDETYQYLDVSSGNLNSLYPGTPGPLKNAWPNPSHTDYARWRQLGISSNSPVIFGYAVKAGPTGSTPGSIPGAPDFGWSSAAATGPWYVIRVVGDQDGDRNLAVFVGSSFTTDVWVGNKLE